jgi:hypothetical protein
MKTILSLVLIISLLASSCDNSSIGCGEFRVADTTLMEGRPTVVYKYCDSSNFTISVRVMVRTSDSSKVVVDRLETKETWIMKEGDRIFLDSMNEVSTHWQRIEGYKKYLQFKGPNERYGAAVFLPVNEY